MILTEAMPSDITKVEQPDTSKEAEKKDNISWFSVDHEVKLGKQLGFLEKTALADAWKFHGNIEAFSPQPENVVRVFLKQNNLLAEAVHQAFYKHYPLILSPDIIWLTITQGLSNHVAQDPEKMRQHFVDFKGKKTITVSNPEFIKGSTKNDWTTVFPEFCTQISDFIGKETVSLIESNFSTTGPTEKIVSQITLMDTVQHYFRYTFMGGCGIPSIGLKGTVDDWKMIRIKTEKLKKYGLDWWLEELLPVLDQFILASQGKPDKNFWRAICNFDGGSGMNGDPITGWLQVFFPYLNAPDIILAKTKDKPKMKENKEGISQYRKALKTGVTASTYKRGGYRDTGCGWGMELKDIPPSMSSAPFTYVDLLTNTSYSMRFMGGIVSVIQNPITMALEPKIGWAVIDQSK